MMPEAVAGGVRSTGEAWAEGVEKLVLVHNSEGPLGTIYLDLQPRFARYVHFQRLAEDACMKTHGCASTWQLKTRTKLAERGNRLAGHSFVALQTEQGGGRISLHAALRASPT